MVAGTVTYTTQQTQETNFHALSVNRTCDPSNQEAADPRLRLQDDRELLHKRPTEQHRVLNRSQLQPLRWQQPTN